MKKVIRFLLKVVRTVIIIAKAVMETVAVWVKVVAELHGLYQPNTA